MHDMKRKMQKENRNVKGEHELDSNSEAELQQTIFFITVQYAGYFI